MMPRIESELLPDSAAQEAVNARFNGGAAEPWKAPATVLTLSSTPPIRSIYRFGQGLNSETQFWFESAVDADFVKGPVIGDTQERTYWTDGVYPKKTDATIATASAPYPSASYRLGIPAPGVSPAPAYTPSASVNGTPSNANDPKTTSVYVATYVTAWGEESAPSAPSNLVTWQPGQSVTVTLPGNLTGPYNVTKVRLYRSNTGTSRTNYQFVSEVSVGTPSYTDTKTASQLGEVLATFDWDTPPDSLVGLCYVGNEILAGFYENTVAFSEPGVPYAWPIKYRLSFDAPIVGIKAFGQTLFVGTRRGCHLITVVDPANTNTELLQEAPSCVSKRSVVAMMGGVVWASPDGLYYVGPSGVRNLTDPIMTREQWQAYKPESISGYEYNGSYYATYDTGTQQGTLIFTFGERASFVESDQYFTAAYYEKLTDTLFVVQGNILKKWNAGSALTMRWRSRRWYFPATAALSAARVEAAAYPVTFRVFADGVQLGPDITVNDNLPFRLPGYRGVRYEFEVVSTAKVKGAWMATSPTELGAV
jgi:hypothetical protein